MGNFRFGQQVQGNVYSLGSGRPATATSRNRTSASCPAPMPGGSSSMSNRMPSPSGGYDITRFNPAYDRLEEGSVIEDWIPRDLPGINKMLRIIYTRDAIAGPAVDIMSNLPWSEFDVVGVDDPKIRQFYEDAAQVFGDKAQELPAITIEYLALGRFCASLIYNEAKGYWTDFVPHDSDFLTITPIPVRNCDPKIDLVMSPGYRQFVTSDDYRDQAARDRLPDYLLQKMRTGQPIPLDPLNTLYIRRKSSPYDFVGTSIYCVTGDTLISTAKGLIRIDELHDEVADPCEVEKTMTVATLDGGLAKTSHWVYSGEACPVEIVTENGYNLSGTDDHPVLTLNEESLDIEFKTLKDANVGDLVAIDYKSELWPQEALVLDAVVADLPKRRKAIDVDIPRVMTSDLALILGYLASEGHVGRRIEFGNTDPEVIEDFKQAWMRVFPNSVLTERKGNKDIPLLTCYSVVVLDFIKALFGGHTSTYGKEIPWAILQSTREHAASFLSGLFEGDGTAAENLVHLYSINEEMLKQVQVILLKFGILSHRPDPEDVQKRRERYENCWGTCSLLTVSGVFKDRFVEEIQFRSTFKKRFDEIRHSKCDVVRLKAGKFAVAVADKRRVEGRGPGWYRNDDNKEVRVSIAYDLQRDSFDSLRPDKQENLAKISASAVEKIKEVEACGYFWTRIRYKKKLYQSQKVYDLCVPKTEAFIGNGIAQHNTRIIPFWALEKSLMNSSVTAARRRAGNILHLTCGVDERWEPTMEEMEDLAGLFVQADEDPVGAVVATRTGVDAQEVRQGGQLWKWSDEWQIFSEGKMRGLGISEALLSGDATYNNMEQAKSVFTEQIRTLRFFLTQQVYLKQFRILARAHGFVKRKKAELDHRVRTTPSPVQRDRPLVEDYQDISLENLSQTDAMDLPEEDLLVPNIQWKKTLLPEGDREYLELLQTLKEEGVPIPLKVWAARGGYDLHEAMEMLEEDLQIRKKVKNWQDKAGVNEDDEAFGEAEAQPSHIFWDRGQQFMQLRKQEAQSCLQEIVNTVYQPGKRQALADTKWVMRTLNDKLKNHRKVELMAYVMMRLGVARGLPISAETCKDIADWFANNETLKTKIRMRELQYLAQAVAHQDTQKVDVTKLAQSTVDQIKDKDSVLGKTMDASFKSKDLAPSSPTLFSGQLS